MISGAAISAVPISALLTVITPPPPPPPPPVVQPPQGGGLGKWHKKRRKLAYDEWQSYVEYRDQLRVAGLQKQAIAEPIRDGAAVGGKQLSVTAKRPEPDVLIPPRMPTLARADPAELMQQVKRIKADIESVNAAVALARKIADDEEDDMEVILVSLH